MISEEVYALRKHVEEQNSKFVIIVMEMENETKLCDFVAQKKK